VPLPPLVAGAVPDFTSIWNSSSFSGKGWYACTPTLLQTKSLNKNINIQWIVCNVLSLFLGGDTFTGHIIPALPAALCLWINLEESKDTRLR